ncbi:MAG: aldose epimerase [Vulcanimicrobiota bacterium]
MLTISNQDTQIQIAPERGAIVTSLKVHGHELLFLNQATFDDPRANVRGGIPVLFPICGPLAGPDDAWAGQRFAMKQHGFARNLAWPLVEHSPDKLALELVDSPETRAQYPFAFRYRLTFRALPDGLAIDQEVENRGAETMPFQLGFHPYFLASDKPALGWRLPVSDYQDHKSEAGGPFHGFDFAADEIDWAFPEPITRKASFVDPGRGLEVSLTYEEPYRMLVFWTLKDQPFVCLEPWTSGRLAFPGGPVERLAPGGRLETGVTVTASALG